MFARLSTGVVIIAIVVSSKLAAQEKPMAKTCQHVLVVTDDLDENTHRFVSYALTAGNDQDDDPKRVRIEVTLAKSTPVKRDLDLPKNAIWLDDLDEKRLSKFHSIYLIDVEKLSDKVTRMIRTRVQAGTGLCVFLGARADAKFYHPNPKAMRNKLFGLPIAPVAKSSARAVRTIKLVAKDHPVFAFFEKKETKGLLDQIFVLQHRDVDHRAAANDDTKVLCNIDNGDPLIVEHSCGKGRVITFLTSPDRLWTNWPFETSWLIMLDQLQE